MQDRYVLPPDFIPSKADIAGAAIHARRVADEAGLARDFCRRSGCRRNGRCVGPPGGTMLLPCLQQLRDESPAAQARKRREAEERAEMAAKLERILDSLAAQSGETERRAADATAIAATRDADPPPPAPERPALSPPERVAGTKPPVARDAPMVRSFDEKAFPWLRAYRPRGLSG